jgi:hypothetical protein
MNSIQGAATLAAMNQLRAVDEMEADMVKAQMQVEKAKHEYKIWQLYQDLQTDIFKTQQEVFLYRAKTDDSIIDKWDSFIKGG